MGKINNLIYGTLIGGLSLVSLNGNSQDVFGCGYIRKLEVNRISDYNENKKKEFYEIPKVEFCEPFEDESKNSLEGKIMNIYFQTKKCDLSGTDSIDLKRYVLKFIKPIYDLEKITVFNVEGFADCRGSGIENYELSHRRAEATAKYLDYLSRNIVSPSIEIYTSAFGDLQSRETTDSIEMQRDRVVRIIPNENPLKHALDICKSRIVLLDQSGSMSVNGSPYWKYSQKYNFSDSAEVFSYSEFIPPRGLKKEELDPEKFPGINHTYNINTEDAYGATSYYPAKEKLISSDFVKQNEIITVVINGKNDFEGYNSERIISLAQSKNVRFNMIGFELSGKYVRDFIEIANQTGGKYYFVKRFN